MGLLKKNKKKISDMKPRGGKSSSEESPFRPVHVRKKAPCGGSCPSGTKIRDVLTTIAQTEDAGRTYPESYEKAYNIIIENNPFPSSCGRVCPHPCETGCNRTYKDGAVAINNVERFLGDYAIDKNLPIRMMSDEEHSEKVAIIGAGPAGLSAAYHLAIRGYKPSIFEAFPKAGGMLRYGIPDYRLPQDVLDKEIQRILDLGVELKTNTIIGNDVAYEQLQKDYDAIFVGIGAHKGRSLRLEGEDSDNVMSGARFLNQVNSGESIEVGDKVLVIGGGDTAIDAARISKRLGADVTIVYRRTREEMPAIEEEIVGAEEEGINFHFLAAPDSFEIEDGKVKSMKCQQMELGEPDDSGRRRPVPVEGEYFDIETTFVIPAISQEPDFEPLENLREGRDWVKADEEGKTEIEKTYAGGDVLDLGLVTIAISQGKKAAINIHNAFRGITPEPEEELQVVDKDQVILSWYDEKERHEEEALAPEKRVKDLSAEITKTLTEEALIDEAKRCMSCGSCFDCGTCWSLCQDQVIQKPLKKFEPYTFKLDVCQGCGKCAEACPCGFIEMKHPMTGEFKKIERVK